MFTISFGVWCRSCHRIAVKEQLDEHESVRAKKEALLQLHEQQQLSEVCNDAQQVRRMGGVNHHWRKMEKDLIP